MTATIKLTPESARRIYERWRPCFRWGYQCCPGELVYKSELVFLPLADADRKHIPIIHRRIVLDTSTTNE